MYMISQAIVLKKYPAAVITLMFSYCLICTVLSGAVSLIVETDLSSFSLEPYSRLFSVLFSGIFGYAFLVTVQSWCVRKEGPTFCSYVSSGWNCDRCHLFRRRFLSWKFVGINYCCHRILYRDVGKSPRTKDIGLECELKVGR
ncbi:WAT1-related protein At3g18200-like [Helianthus annuus]|uniref:WAT1-related protein At3g18200-like n=1 Tax=Helianthus annuus TaxID=4232 RepID=UPI000B90877A|nr:WAT1-related protein At3g18200-like [Helianthus annuus]